MISFKPLYPDYCFMFPFRSIYFFSLFRLLRKVLNFVTVIVILFLSSFCFMYLFLGALIFFSLGICSFFITEGHLWQLGVCNSCTMPWKRFQLQVVILSNSQTIIYAVLCHCFPQYRNSRSHKIHGIGFLKPHYVLFFKLH